MSHDHPRAGIAFMVGATFILASQDAISRHLAETYNTFMIVTIRYWVFAAAVLIWAKRTGRWRTRQPRLQITRGVLLAAEICVMVYAFTLLGLIESQAVFICYPLLVAALSAPVLGERVGPWRWLAIGVGALGVWVILNPGGAVFQPAAIVPLISALMFAAYNLLNRLAARHDSAEVSFFWTGLAGAVVLTPAGLWMWEPMTPADWGWMALLCVTAMAGHFALIKAYALAEASTVQPFAYLHLVFGGALAITIFGEALRINVAIGAVIVVTAGLVTLWRTGRAQRQQRAG